MLDLPGNWPPKTAPEEKPIDLAPGADGATAPPVQSDLFRSRRFVMRNARKLTKRAAAKLRAEGVTAAAIAAQFGVCEGTVYRRLHGTRGDTAKKWDKGGLTPPRMPAAAAKPDGGIWPVDDLLDFASEFEPELSALKHRRKELERLLFRCNRAIASLSEKTL